MYIYNTPELKAAIDEMCSTRQSEDNEVLDTVIETQGLLQQTVLEHFGTRGLEAPPTKKFNKLENRMNDIKKRKGGTGNEGEGEEDGVEGGSTSQRSESKEGEGKE